MAATVRNFGAYRAGPHAWMLGRLIVPAARMKEFADEFAAVATVKAIEGVWPLSILGQGGDDAVTFAANLAKDVQSWARLREHFPGRLDGQSWELRLPTGMVAAADEDLITECAKAAIDQLAGMVDSPRVAFEIPWVGDWAATVPPAVAALSDAQRSVGSRATLSAKMRTGSVEPSQVPGAAQVACFIAACRAMDVPFKATAGLHHPVRHVDPDLGVPVFGFFNVFGAALFAKLREWDEADLQKVLEEREVANFRFAPDAFCWKNECAELAEITAARAQFAWSFGSCSFDEPIADLNKLGLLPAE
jgi:hypothetical protein